MGVEETRARVSSARNGRGVSVRKIGIENGVRVIGVVIIQRPKMMIMLRDIINLPFSSFLAHFLYIFGLYRRVSFFIVIIIIRVTIAKIINNK